ncbi:S-adenosyl-L-methionine-dependent methyltransferase [Annulohypoxylon moriforme]|nr:S-adenosyl-L-methionine-dependent methyltransferase [Annulohypoxylon moriforme]
MSTAAESILNQLKDVGSITDTASRRKLIADLHGLAYSLEDVDDTIHRYGYLHLQTAAVKVGFDLGLFRYMSKRDRPATLQEIEQNISAETPFLARYLSYVSAVGIIDETGKGEYRSNNVTKNLATKVAEAGISHCFTTIGPQFQALPSYMKATGYKNPTNELQAVFQTAWKSPHHAFSWYSENPEALGYFNDYMAFRRQPELSWLAVYPVKEETNGLNDPTRPIYVNVGGGVGHQCAQFKEMYPEIIGRVILQDMPHTIEKALPIPGVEPMVHDFFQPQPIKGAKFYHSRGVLHNHPDHKVRQLLENTRSALASDSVILLDEMVLPESGVNSYAAAMDLTMMAAFSAGERTEDQWCRLLDDVGMKLVKTYNYNPLSYESVMDVRIK